jgi:hypothetical protein
MDTTETLRETLESLRTSFHEHEKEHAQMMTRSWWWLIGSLGTIVAIGIWVGTINAEVKHTQVTLQDKVSRDEFLGAVANFNTKFDNIYTVQQENKDTLKEIMRLLNNR